MAERIGYNIRSIEDVDGVIGVGISLLRSTKTGAPANVEKGRLGVNELPYLLNSIMRSGVLNDTSPIGFDYTFKPVDEEVAGFRLSKGHGFPYVLGFKLNNDKYFDIT